MLKLPEGALDILGKGSVLDIAISPDGSTLAVGGFRALYFYELSTMLPIAVWETPVRRLTYSNDGQWLATSNGNGCVRVWDVHHGKCVSKKNLNMARMFGARRKVINHLAFSPNKQYLAASNGRDYTIEVWNPETGEPVIALYDDVDTEHGSCSVVRPIAFSPDSNMLACASPEGFLVETERKTDFISLWNLESRELIACLKGFPNFLYSLCFSDCGKFLAAGAQNGVVQVWNVAREFLHREYSAIGNSAMHVSYSEEGILRATETSRYNSNGNSYINVWDVESGETLHTYLEDKKFGINAFHFTNGSRLGIATPSEFHVWNAENANLQKVAHLHIGPPTALAFSPNANILVDGYWNGLILFWDTARFTAGTPVTEKHTESKNGSETLIELSEQQPIVFKPKGTVNSLTVTNTGKVYATSIEETACHVWEVQPAIGKSQDFIHLQTDSELVLTTSFTPPTAPDETVLSPNANLLICSDDEGLLYVWDTERKELLCTLVADTDRIRSLIISPDSKKLMSISSEGPNACLWTIPDGERINEFQGDDTGVAAFSPDSRTIACVLRGEIMFWDIATREFFLKLPIRQGSWDSLAFSPCGRYLASGAYVLQDGSIVGEMPVNLWNISTRETVTTFFGHTRSIDTLAFSADGTVLASGSCDGTIVLWDMKPYL